MSENRDQELVSLQRKRLFLEKMAYTYERLRITTLDTRRREKNLSVLDKIFALKVPPMETLNMAFTLTQARLVGEYIETLKADKEKAYHRRRYPATFRDGDQKLKELSRMIDGGRRVGLNVNDLIDALRAKGNYEMAKSLRRVGLRRLEERIHGELNFRYLRQELNRVSGVSGKHTNLPELYLDHATRSLCDCFKKHTGNPQYGLVGMMLCAAGLETVKIASDEPLEVKYRRLRKRVADRMRRMK